MKIASVAVAALALLTIGPNASPEQAPSAAPGAKPATPPCSTPEHRQFDFWVGDWNVKDPQGAQAGTNLITREFDGCVIQEHWVGSRGMRGSSFNIYSPATKTWHQSWVDSNG